MNWLSIITSNINVPRLWVYKKIRLLHIPTSLANILIKHHLPTRNGSDPKISDNFLALKIMPLNRQFVKTQSS